MHRAELHCVLRHEVLEEAHAYRYERATIPNIGATGANRTTHNQIRSVRGAGEAQLPVSHAASEDRWSGNEPPDSSDVQHTAGAAPGTAIGNCLQFKLFALVFS